MSIKIRQTVSDLLHTIVEFMKKYLRTQKTLHKESVQQESVDSVGGSFASATTMRFFNSADVSSASDTAT